MKMNAFFEEIVPKAKANSKATTAAVFGFFFLVYCIYFDKKRRSDPNFRRKLKERRTKGLRCEIRSRVRLPDMRDNEAVLRFLLQEIKKGEDCLGKGDSEGGVEHMAYAVAVCGQPNKLLEVLQVTLLPHVFNRLLERLPELSREISENPTGSSLN